MSYDIWLNDPVTNQRIEFDSVHDMRGGTYALGGTREAWLNITYNYADYYYEVFDEDGIRHIYGMTGAESIPVLRIMIDQITNRYQKDGQWISTMRTKARFLDENGNEFRDIVEAVRSGREYKTEEYEVEVSEGPNEDYWEDTAANAIRPLHQLIAMAQMRPDGIWGGD